MVQLQIRQVVSIWLQHWTTRSAVTVEFTWSTGISTAVFSSSCTSSAPRTSSLLLRPALLNTLGLTVTNRHFNLYSHAHVTEHEYLKIKYCSSPDPLVSVSLACPLFLRTLTGLAKNTEGSSTACVLAPCCAAWSDAASSPVDLILRPSDWGLHEFN